MEHPDDENSYFYSNLPIYSVSPEELFSNEKEFVSVPADWVLVVLDIEKSTQAVRYKMHRDINRIAAESIMVVLNEIKSLNQKIEIPFFFGGDGASFIIPKVFLQQIRLVLDDFRYHIFTDYFLNLRIGFVHMEEIYKRGNILKIARLSYHGQFTIPIVLGDGLRVGDSIIKSQYSDERDEPHFEMFVDTDGATELWRNIRFRKSKKRVLCFLISVRNMSKQAEIFADIHRKTTSIFGEFGERTVITSRQLKRKDTLTKLYLHHLKSFNSFYLERIVVKIFRKFYFRWFRRGIDFAETLSKCILPSLYDGTYDDILIGSKEQIASFISHLQMLENRQQIYFGSSMSDKAIIKCSLKTGIDQTVYLLDGGEGGYTAASKVLKPKIRKDKHNT